MGEHLLSLLHIQKLGHPIGEIRLRALSSVISKYNLNLVDENNLQNTKLLLEKLFNWFSFEKFSEEEKVLKLILKIMKYKNSDLILKEIGTKVLAENLTKIEKKVGYISIIQDIKECIKQADNSNFYSEIQTPNIPEIVEPKDKRNCEYIATFRKHQEVEHQTEDTKEVENFDHTHQKSIFRVEYFPWQHLTSGDKHVLISVFDGLRYVNNTNSILQSCQFYNEVVLRDFPSEVFIQRPLIVRTFIKLLENSGKEVRIPVLICLIKTVQSVKESALLALNPLMFHQKEEFYSTFVLPADPEDDTEMHLNMGFCDADESDNDMMDRNLSKYQLSLPQFCFELLVQILPHLAKKCCREETNYLISLIFETFDCLTFNMMGSLKKEFRSEIFKVFGMLQECLNYHKGKSQISYVILLYITMKLINSLKSDELGECLPKNLSIELESCVSNFVLVIMFPRLHSEILKYLKNSQRQLEVLQDYKDYLIVFESFKSSMKFLKCSKPKSKMERLELVYSSLTGLNFHQNFEVINFFVDSCLLKWRKSQLKEQESKLREKILVKLLAHNNVFVKTSIYKEINEYAVKLLGVDEAIHPNYECPGDRMDFLFHVEVLTEIICHGLSSSLFEVRKYSSEIVVHFLKSKYLMSDNCWSDFMNNLIPCLSLLQCYGDKSSTLGRCIVKMFDPDVAKTNCLPILEVLKGNIRFLFSKNNLTRDEALSRLFWLLGKDDRDNEKLPRMNVLTGLNLSGICSCVKPEEFSKIRQPFYSPSRLSEVLEMLNSDNIEPNLRRSVLSQISVMIDDVHLHGSFIEQKGLEKILEIMENCLIEKEYRNYPDSVIPIVYILKVLSLHNVSVRQDLSSQLEVLFNILRSLFLFSSDDSLRQSAVELLCLLLYNNCILRVPPDISIKCIISFPEVVVNKMCLPFMSHVHWKTSKHLEASTKKTLMNKESFSKLIRASYAIQWVGSLPDVLSMQQCDLPGKAYSPGLPDDMKILYKDVEELKNCAFGVSVKQTLYGIQNATTHEAVFDSLHKLHSYLLLYNIDKSVQEKTSKDVSSETTLSHMLWESTLERFMLSHPSCDLDEILLLQVVRFVQLLLKSFKSERLINWVGKLLVDEYQPIPKMLKKIGSEDYGFMGRELRLAVIELTQEIVREKNSLDPKKWFFYMNLISNHLKLDKKEEFYNVAYVDWLLSLLVDLTGNHLWSFGTKPDFLENLIIRIMEIIVAFHCTKDSGVSYMGLNIIKNSLFVLNHILSDSQTDVKDWEKVWFQAFSNIIGHKRDANFCWLLSLWFMRDSVIRALAFQLFAGFATSSSGCEFLINRLSIPYEQIWMQGFRILFDENECGFVREKVALFLSNIIIYGTKISSGCFLENLIKINFYGEILKIVLNFHFDLTLPFVTVNSTSNIFEGQVVTTPSFMSAICTLIQSVMFFDPTNVSDKILESGIIDSLIKAFIDIPESTGSFEKHHGSEDTLEMCITSCRLITKCISYSWMAHSFVLQSPQFVNFLFTMLNSSLYCECSRTIVSYKNELWCEILMLFSALLLDNPEANKNNNANPGFSLLNRCMTENGTDHFISSLFIALSCDVSYLRASVFNFFINFFRQEISAPKHVSISDIFERKISTKALKSAVQFGWKGLIISEKLTLNFGIRIADILHQLFLLSTSCIVQAFKISVADCLGSLLAVCQSAQNYCVDKGLPDFLITALKQICVKLSLESVENLKKSSHKKKIEPLLTELETLHRLLCNLMLNNEKSKNAVADCGLTAVVHKLWPWCVAKHCLHIVTLKMLCTFSHFCDQGCRTLVLSSSLSVLGLKKSSGPATLINAIMNQVSLEMDLISKTHTSQILSLCLQLLSNSCRVTECRSVISKANFLQSFINVHPNRKKKSYGEGVVESWLKFFIVFSSHQEGQLILTKNQDLLDVLILLSSSSKIQYRTNALTVLRNICFHQLNRVRMLSYTQFISLMYDILDSNESKDVQAVVTMLWALSCNTQKAKVIIRSSGFEAKLITAKRNFILKDDTETAELIEVVLDILKNK